MKHLLHSFWMIALLICCNIQQASAQMQMPPIPVDKNVRIGKLDNGLTYYIRHNALPEHRVEFYIAQKVGSILEEPHQRGLAHFLEHMCFNGTKHFPGDERGLGVVPWCETKGIKFGVNLNAYTSVDETVYNISNVPTDNRNVVDSCLLILHDWSSAVLLTDKEIDKERGVIHEEWRSRNSGIMRLYTEAQPTMYPGSKYADCMPIGSIDVIDHFPYQAIRDYYTKWYRPDQQGIIIVGDIDVDAMEQKLKNTFADVKAPVNPAERVYFPVPDNKEPLVYIGKDKEIDNPSFMIFFKQDATPDSVKGNMMYMLQDYLLSMGMDMLNNRLNELRQSANPPFIYASAGYDDYFLAKTKEAFTLSAGSKADGISQALKAVLTEVERARRFGFTESEYERARANYLQRLESAYTEREKNKNDVYVRQYVQHFLNAEPIPGIEFEYSTMNQVAPNIPVAAINQLVQTQLVADTNQVVFIAAPEKEGMKYPTREEVVALLKGMKDLDVTAYVDQVSDEPLMKEAPKGGKIVSEKQNAIYGTTELTLSNGVKVYIKKTDFKADEIRMKAYSAGGNSLFETKDALNFNQHVMNGVISAGGIGNFSKVNLTKMLAGKKVSVNAGVSSTQEYVSGNCSPKDFETMMQLTYLNFTAPRKDEDAFSSFKSRLKAQLESAEANPLSSVTDTLRKVMYNNHPRSISLKPDMVDKIDYDRIIELYKERFADASDFKFYFVGNIDLEKAKPLIAQYLGSLPATHAGQESVRDNQMDIQPGNIVNEYAKEQQTPMATVIMVYNGKCEYTLKNSILMSFLTQALDLVYTEEVREKEGGTYGVNTYGSLTKAPKEEMILQIVYQTDPSKKDHLNGIIDEQMKKMAEEGPTAEHLQKIKEYMLKKYKDHQKENSYWLGNLDEYFSTGIDNTKDYEATINAVTAQDIRQFAADILKQGNKITVIMTVPEAK
ncbi:zinc protease [Bacteroides zoogleoformans]|uniref:Peptidase M16 n=1 Tax=Bacteroides zoogleoformans TaxID=28119 RepID=A0ABM6T5X5_9BACE|nr:M16 family metallopeptidase [Bacteroides zoogleoformans]AVM51754.1 peptidase M16 [Bacteroides zoogleoformans]TWJ13816.1 zinc protease [Bacteroides zoogleoformans]